MKKFLMGVSVAALALGAVGASFAQDIESVCLITDVGTVNDGTFNQYAYEGMALAVEEFDIDSTYIETQSEADYDANINTCVEQGYDIIVTVGFLIADATKAAADANPDTYFVGVDQFLFEGPTNYVGIQFREDQAGFLVGALAALAAEEAGGSTIAGVYGIEIPPVVKFRNGYEQGARYINPELNILGKYEATFTDRAVGASTARTFVEEGAVVIFGAGGPTGSGAIAEAATAGVYVIGVDQDEYFTTFGSGETEGAEFLISSAQKAVDVGVYDMIAALVEGDMEAFVGGGNYILDVANGGITFAPKHDATLDDALYEQVEAIKQMLIDGDLDTGIDPASGEIIAPEATATP
jgi:basic membrane protein A